jgi:hypothetical protein
LINPNLPSEPFKDNLYNESLATPSVAVENFVVQQTFRLPLPIVLAQQ